MGILQDSLNQALQEVPSKILADILSEKLVAQGITLTAREQERLISHINKGMGEAFNFRRWRWWDKRQIVIKFTEEDVFSVHDHITEFLDSKLQDLIDSAINDLSLSIFEKLKHDWPEQLRWQDHTLRGFDGRLKELWGVAINLLRMMLTISRELGEMTHNSIASNPEFSSPHLLDVLSRLHARACQVTDEIVCLLRSGFADGAMARWRTLHEIAIVARFIADHGDDLAKRYSDHQVVESFRAAEDYRACSERLGYEPLTESEFNDIRQEYDRVIRCYGEPFKTQYGWASDILGHKRPALKDIERAAGIDHFRAHYRMASHNIHANPKGVFFRLGLSDEIDMFLAGPSNAGLADPGHCTAISLLHVSVAQGLILPDLDSLVGLRILGRLEREAGEAFHQAHQYLEESAVV